MTSPAAPVSSAPPSGVASRVACSFSPPPTDLSRGTWDAIVIGAGPAGAASAYLLAKRGWRVLLLERSTWPREKVCGGCLSASAVACLERIGLTKLLDGAVPIEASIVHVAGAAVRLPAQSVLAIRRAEFDTELVAAFQSLGGTFVANASASLRAGEPGRDRRFVRAAVGGEAIDLYGRTILACDGLAGSSLSEEPWARWTIADDAYIGVGATVELESFPLAAHEIHMHIGDGGYVGAVRYASGHVHLAAALDPRRTRTVGGPWHQVVSILRACGKTLSSSQIRFKGAPTLTRFRRQLGGHRVLAVGDACGYIEPFTGEGIAWALRSAIEATALLQDDWSDQTPQRWGDLHASALKRKQAVCHAVRHVARRPLLARTMIELLRHVPSISCFMTRADEVRA